MQRGSRGKQGQTFTAKVGDLVVHGGYDKIITFCEGKGYEMERAKDFRARDFYWQHAEHWKRLKNGSA